MHVPIAGSFAVGLLATEAWGLFHEELGMRVPARRFEDVWLLGEWTHDLSEDAFPSRIREQQRIDALADQDLEQALRAHPESYPAKWINQHSSLESELEIRDLNVFSHHHNIDTAYFPRITWMFDAGRRFPSALLPLFSREQEALVAPEEFDPAFSEVLLRLADHAYNLFSGKPESAAISELAEWADGEGFDSAGTVADSTLWCLDAIQRSGSDQELDSLL